MRVLKDLFDFKILKYTFLPFLISIVFWGVVFLLFKNEIYDFFYSYVKHLPFSNSLEKFLSGVGSFLVLLVLYYLSVVSTLGVFSSFFIDKITLRINEKHFACNVKKTSFKDVLKGVLISLKAFFIYLVLFVFTFWFLFIPIINLFYQALMWSLLNKKPLVFDSSYLFVEPSEFERENNLKIWILVFFSSFIYFVPFINLFGYTFQLILLTHMALNFCKGRK